MKATRPLLLPGGPDDCPVTVVEYNENGSHWMLKCGTDHNHVVDAVGIPIFATSNLVGAKMLRSDTWLNSISIHIVPHKLGKDRRTVEGVADGYIDFAPKLIFASSEAIMEYWNTTQFDRFNNHDPSSATKAMAGRALRKSGVEYPEPDAYVECVKEFNRLVPDLNLEIIETKENYEGCVKCTLFDGHPVWLIWERS